MKLLIEPTEEFVDIAPADQVRGLKAHAGTIRARVWRAAAPDGTVLHAFVAAIAAAQGAPINDELARALVALAGPVVSPVLDIPPAPAAPAPDPAGMVLYPHGDPACAAAANTVDVLQPSLEWLAERVGIKTMLDALATLYLHWVVRHYGAGTARWHLERMREAVAQIAAGVADTRIAAAAQGRA